MGAWLSSYKRRIGDTWNGPPFERFLTTPVAHCTTQKVVCLQGNTAREPFLPGAGTVDWGVLSAAN